MKRRKHLYPHYGAAVMTGMSLVGSSLPSLNVQLCPRVWSEEDEDCGATGVMRPEVRSEEPPTSQF